MMMRLLLLLAVCLYTVGGVRVTLSHVKTSLERGWIHLKLDTTGHTGRTPRVVRVDWCSAITPGSTKPHINRKDGTCTGSNVMHKQIYPPPLKKGERYPDVKEIREVIGIRSRDMSVFVNPEKFGGLDPTREAYVMVYTRFDNTPTEYQHYPETQALNGEHDTTLEQDTVKRSVPSRVVKASDKNVVVNVLRLDASLENGNDADHVEWSEPSHATVNMITNAPTPYNPPWYIYSLGFMLLFVCSFGLVIVMLINKEPGGWSRWSQKLGLVKVKVERSYGDTDYEFSFNGRGGATKRPVDVREERKKENMALLMEMGDANYAFKQNL